MYENQATGTAPYATKPDTGTLWPRRKQTDKHPDLGGQAYMSDSLLAEMVARRQRGEDAVLQIAAWKKIGQRDGETYLSLSLRPHEERPPESAVPQQDGAYSQQGFQGSPTGTALAGPPPPPWVKQPAPARPPGEQYRNPQSGPQPIPPGGHRW